MDSFNSQKPTIFVVIVVSLLIQSYSLDSDQQNLPHVTPSVFSEGILLTVNGLQQRTSQTTVGEKSTHQKSCLFGPEAEDQEQKLVELFASDLTGNYERAYQRRQRRMGGFLEQRIPTLQTPFRGTTIVLQRKEWLCCQEFQNINYPVCQAFGNRTME